MACESFERKLSLFLDGELPEEEKAAVTKHLKNCADCAAIYDSFRKIDGLYLETQPLSPGRSFTASVMKNVKPSGISWWKVAATVLIFVSGWGMGVWTERTRKIENQPQTAENTESSWRFPYIVKVKDAPYGYYVIKNESDEKKWHEFLKDYIREVKMEEEKTKLNQYGIDLIPVQFIQSGDF